MSGTMPGWVAAGELTNAGIRYLLPTIASISMGRFIRAVLCFLFTLFCRTGMSRVSDGG
jgi:hypothetical protein